MKRSRQDRERKGGGTSQADAARPAARAPGSLSRPDLEEDGERFRALSVSAFDMISEIDRSGRVTYVSPNHARMAGREPSELVHLLNLGNVDAADRERVSREFRALFERGENVRTVFRTRGVEDRLHWVELTGTPLQTPEGEPRALLLSRDVTEQKEIEARLEASRERFRSIAENAYDMIAEFDAQARVLFVNDQARHTFGLDPEGPWTRDPLAIVHPDDRPVVKAELRALVQGASSSTVRCRASHSDGRELFVEARYRRYVSAQGEPRIHMIARDVSALVEKERRIEESEARYRLLVEGSPLGIFVVQGGVVVFANAAGASVCGAESPEEVIGTRMVDLLHPDDAVAIPRLVARAERGGSIPDLAEARLVGFDDEVRDVIATGSIIDFEGSPAYQGIVRDVTTLRAAERERRRLELQLQEARKLESLGMLAGGIAHDFNNLLAVVTSNARFARDLTTHEEGVEALSDAIEAAEQAARLTQQLLAYAGRRSPDVRSTDLSGLVRNGESLLASALPPGVSLSTDLVGPIPRVRADVVQLEQVLMNLVINAGDAMAECGGEVCVATGRGRVTARQIRDWVVGADLRPGEYAFLEVRDAGIGMDAQTRARVFEPFFSTKRDGHGLGLAAVLGMVRGHHGGVALDTEPGRGTRFRVYLPAEPTRTSDAGAVMTIGLDDRAAAALSDALARRGHAALQASDVDAACDLLRRHGEEVEAVVLGADSSDEAVAVITRLRALRPGLPALWVGTAPPETLERLQAEGLTEAVGGRDAARRIADGLEALLGKA